MIRTFIAIDLPPGVRESLDRLERELKSADAAVSWVNPDRIHLTLKFLGNVPQEKIAEIQEAIGRVAVSSFPFNLQPSGCGAFPSLKQMRVVWVGLRCADDSLSALQKKVESAMTPLGFEPEDRPFKPHLTLGRVKGRQKMRTLESILLQRQSFEAEAFDVADIVLYKSDLRPDGARYTPLFRAALTGRPD